MRLLKTKKKVGGIFLEEARKAVRKGGWNPDYDLEIFNPDNPYAGSINYGYRADKVRLIEPKDLDMQVAKALSFIDSPSVIDSRKVFSDLVASRVYVQIGCFKVCPYSASDYYEIREACRDGLISAGVSESEVIKYTVAVTSLFISSVVASVYAVSGPDPESLRFGWPFDHILSFANTGKTLRMCISLYANIQLRLWADNKELCETLRSCFYSPFETLDFETDRGVAILLDSFDYVGVEQDGIVWSDDQKDGCELIINELSINFRSWPIKAFQFAEMIAPYIIADEKGRQPPRPSQAQTEFYGSSGRPSERAEVRFGQIRSAIPHSIDEQSDRNNLQHFQMGDFPIDPFSERLRMDTSFRRRLIQIGLNRGKTPNTLDFETLDAIYRSRIANMKIVGEITRKPGMAFQIAHMAREELGATLPSLNDIDWGATLIGLNGDLQLYRKIMPITSQTPARMHLSSFPDLLLIVDSSGSMTWDPIGGSGPYDSLLRAVYSVFDFLERHSKAQYMRFAVVNFSAITLTTGWQDYSDLRKIKQMLVKHQNGGTKLDCKVINNIINTSQDSFMCLMITDAQISNIDDVWQTVQRMTARGNKFVLIQIGARSKFSEKVQANELAAHVISNHRQLHGLCLDYAQKVW